MFYLKLIFIHIDKQHWCTKAVPSVHIDYNAFLLLFKKLSSFSQSTVHVKTYICKNLKSCLFPKIIIFYFLPSVRTQWTTVQNISINERNKIFVITKLHFYIFRRSIKIGFGKKLFLKLFFYVLEPRWTIVPNLLHFGWNSQTWAPHCNSPLPLIFK